MASVPLSTHFLPSLLVRRVCEDCITNDECGYCYDDNQPEAATCLLAQDDDEDLYADYGRCSKNFTATAGMDLKWTYGYCPTDYTWMAVLGLALFVLSFAPGQLDILCGGCGGCWWWRGGDGGGGGCTTVSRTTRGWPCWAWPSSSAVLPRVSRTVCGGCGGWW